MRANNEGLLIYFRLDGQDRLLQEGASELKLHSWREVGEMESGSRASGKSWQREHHTDHGMFEALKGG